MHHVTRQNQIDAAHYNLHVTILYHLHHVCTKRPALQEFFYDWQPWSMTESTTLLSVAFSTPAVVTGFDDNSMGVRAIDASPAVTGEASIGVVRIVASTRGYCFEPWSGVLQTVQATYAAEMLCCLTESDYCFVCICFCLWAEFLSFLAYAAARALSFASSSGSTGVRAMGCLV